jgi:hypothetical protein
MTLYAPDPMGKAAHKAAQLISRQDLRLLIASSRECTGPERREGLVSFFAAWPRICEAVALLEQVAPECSREGYALAEQAKDFIEGRRA